MLRQELCSTSVMDLNTQHMDVPQETESFNEAPQPHMRPVCIVFKLCGISPVSSAGICKGKELSNSKLSL